MDNSRKICEDPNNTGRLDSRLYQLTDLRIDLVRSYFIFAARVIKSFLPFSIREFNHLHGFKVKNPKTFEEAKHYWILVDWISEDETVEDPLIAAVNIWNSQLVMENAGMVQGTQTVTTYLAAKGIFPPRVTSRPGARTREWTYNWYRKKYGSTFDLNLVRMHEGYTFDPEFKPNEIARQGAGYHFDDSYEDAEKIVKTEQLP